MILKTRTALSRRSPWRWPTTLIALSVALGCPGAATASQLVLGRDALQALVASTLFGDAGRWNLLQGGCFAYLQQPVVALARARVIINARLTARLGIETSGGCAGIDLGSDVALSGVVRGSGSELSLQDIRVDRVGDDSSSQALELVREAVAQAVPRAVKVDLMALVKPTPIPGLAMPARVTRLVVTGVSTGERSVSVLFDLDVAIP